MYAHLELFTVEHNSKANIKICATVSNGSSPAYLSDKTTPISSIQGHGSLRSATTKEFDVPRTNKQFGRIQTMLL